MGKVFKSCKIILINMACGLLIASVVGVIVVGIRILSNPLWWIKLIGVGCILLPFAIAVSKEELKEIWRD